MNFRVNFLLIFGSFTLILSKNDDFFLGKYLIRSLKPGPMDIVTSELDCIKLPPLKIDIILNETIKLTNNGQYVQGEANLGTGSTLSGGPYKDAIYKYHGVQYYWSENTTGPAATTIDGKIGTPIEAITYWYNEEYGSIVNAINYMDGLAAISSRMSVDLEFNKKYTPFFKALQKIKKPSSVNIDHKTSFNWYDKYSQNTTYFAYPACQVSPYSGRRSYCAIVCILEPIIHNVVSLEQFQESFLSLSDIRGKPINNSFPAYPQTGTPIIQSIGIRRRYKNRQ